MIHLNFRSLNFSNLRLLYDSELALPFAVSPLAVVFLATRSPKQDPIAIALPIFIKAANIRIIIDINPLCGVSLPLTPLELGIVGGPASLFDDVGAPLALKQPIDEVAPLELDVWPVIFQHAPDAALPSVPELAIEAPLSVPVDALAMRLVIVEIAPVLEKKPMLEQVSLALLLAVDPLAIILAPIAASKQALPMPQSVPHVAAIRRLVFSARFDAHPAVNLGEHVLRSNAHLLEERGMEVGLWLVMRCEDTSTVAQSLRKLPLVCATVRYNLLTVAMLEVIAPLPSVLIRQFSPLRRILSEQPCLGSESILYVTAQLTKQDWTDDDTAVAVAQATHEVTDVAPVDPLIKIYLLQLAETVHFATFELTRVDKRVLGALEHLKSTVTMVLALEKVADIVLLVGMREDNLAVALVLPVSESATISGKPFLTLSIANVQDTVTQESILISDLL